jgi:hypothetical protein
METRKEARGLIAIRVGARGGAFVTAPVPDMVAEGLADGKPATDWASDSAWTSGVPSSAQAARPKPSVASAVAAKQAA